SQRGPAFDGNLFTRGDSPFDPAGVRLFAESKVNDRVQVFAQVVLHDASSLYLDGAYLMYTPAEGRDLHVLAGKIPWAVGTWGPRTYSSRNPLIGTPLIYAHHTTLLWYDLPPIADALAAPRRLGRLRAVPRRQSGLPAAGGSQRERLHAEARDGRPRAARGPRGGSGRRGAEPLGHADAGRARGLGRLCRGEDGD